MIPCISSIDINIQHVHSVFNLFQANPELNIQRIVLWQSRLVAGVCVLIVTNKNCNMVFIQMRDQDCLYWGHISCDKTQNMPFVLILSYHGHWKLQVTVRLYTVQWHIMGDYWLYGQNLLTTISNDIFKSIHCSQLKSRLKIPPGTLGNECCILDGR